MTPAWILDIPAALMLAIAAVSAARLAAARPRRFGSAVTETGVAHLLMAIAMAGMLTPRLAALPDTAWDAVFGLLTAWFGYRVLQDAAAGSVRALPGARRAPHLVHSAAMLYMFLALASRPAGGSVMGGMAGAGRPAMLQYPTLAVVFALVLVGYSIRDLDQLSGRHYGPARARMSLAGVAPAMPATGAAPATFTAGATAGCRIAIGVTMALMLVLMI